MADELRQSEYEALRRELEATGKRVYDVALGAAAASFVLLAAGLSTQNPWVTLSPLLVLIGAYQTAVQSVRSMRRIVAYLRLFHEGCQRGSVWESLLPYQRAIGKATRNVKRNPTRRLKMAAQFQLIYYPGVVAIGAAWVGTPHTFPAWTWIAKVLATTVWFLMFLVMSRANRELVGDGPVEREFVRQLRLGLALMGDDGRLAAKGADGRECKNPLIQEEERIRDDAEKEKENLNWVQEWADKCLPGSTSDVPKP